MKKLFTLISFLILYSLIFIGCQNTENITSPVSELDKNAAASSSVLTFGCDPSPIDGTVELVAGQHNVVGHATFTKIGDDLKIDYVLDADEIAGGALITEVHIDFAKVLTNDSNAGGFHANKSGNPQPGLFDINAGLTPGQTSWSLTVLKADLLKYLNLPANGTVPANFYIAAHGVVKWGGESICPTLPNGLFRYLAEVPGNNYYVENAKLFNDAAGTTLLYDNLNGWCVNRKNGARPGLYVPVNFLCSTADISGLCLVDHPENIGAVNWVLNNKVVSSTYAPYRTVQVVIWKLLDNNIEPFNPYDTLQVNALYNEALKHTSFVPGCGQIIGVFMYEAGKDYCTQSAMQTMLIERTVACGGSETIWGFDYDNGPVTGLSCRFVEQGNWARYFKF